jgi:PAS domain S-box-containing protein
MTTDKNQKQDFISLERCLYGLGPAVLKSIRDPFGIFHRDHRVIWVNRAMAKIHFKEPEEMQGKICYEVCYNRSAPCDDCPMEEVRNTGRTRVVERWLDFPDGQRRWGEVRAYPIRGEDKSVVAVNVIVIDITSKKHVLQQQQEYSAFLSKKLKEHTAPEQRIQLDGGEISIKVSLSRREMDVLRLITEGYTNIQISDLLTISPNTVKSHTNNIFNKLGVNDRTQAAVLAVRHQLI